MADTLILCYHAVSDRWTADLSVPPGALADQLAGLAHRGYRGVTFTEAVLQPGTGRRVAVTFDDAFASVATLALPLLDGLGWPATVFAVSGFADAGRPLSWPGVEHWAATEHAAELASLAWPQLRGLAAKGWEIGSHTATHPKLTQLGDAELDAELATSRAAVGEALGHDCPSLAYPYGDVDARVVAAARRAGYRAAAALPGRRHAERRLEFPRVGIYRLDDSRRVRVKTAHLTRAARRLAER